MKGDLGIKIAIDVGGTFTDVVLLDEQRGKLFCAKTPTTHKNLAQGVMLGLEEIFQKASSGRDSLQIIHGTTIGTNAVIEGKGAKVGLITTEGFEDVLEIRRVARPKEAAFDFWVDNPPPLVPRYLRKGVRERLNARGEVLIPLDPSSLDEALRVFEEEGVEAVAVVLLFSFANPLHER